MIHLYWAIEDIALTPALRQTLIAALQALGNKGGDRPCHITHWRVRLDNKAILLESLWDEDELTIANMKGRLGALFGVVWKATKRSNRRRAVSAAASSPAARAYSAKAMAAKASL